MEFKITGRHLEITEAIRDYARKKTERMHRFFDRIQEVQVVVDKHDKHEPYFEVEVIADVEHHDPFVAKHNNKDLYACIDETVDKVGRQLADHKKKLRNRKHNNASARQMPRPD